jgi:hypothetical protein
MSAPSNRTGFRPDAPTTGQRPRFRDKQTGIDCGTGSARRAILIGASERRIALCYSVIRVSQTSTGKAAYSIPPYSTGLSGWRRISVTAIRRDPGAGVVADRDARRDYMTEALNEALDLLARPAQSLRRT